MSWLTGCVGLALGVLGFWFWDIDGVMTFKPLDYSPDEIAGLGPAMLALNERQRLLIKTVVDYPEMTHGDAAKYAGYGGEKAAANPDILRQCAFQALSSEKMIAALQEEVSRRYRSRGAIVGLNVMLEIAADPAHKDRLRAADMLASRAGFHSVQEHRVTHTDQTGEEMVEKIRRLAVVLGVDPARLLGGNVSRETSVDTVKVIEHEPRKPSD